MTDDPQPHRDPDAWDRLIAQVGPERIVALIRSWMGARLRAAVAPEDLWQETLLHTWRDAHSHEWQGLPAYRHWVIGIARNRVRDAAEHFGAQKRQGAQDATPISQVDPARTTSPSRIAVRQERADAIVAALEYLPEEQRDVVREHLLAERPMTEVAAELEITVPAAWYRFRRGAAAYANHLAAIESRL